LTHKNKYNGLTYAEDPTVAIIETGNELSGPIFGDMNVPTSWINEIGTFVKSLPGAGSKLFLDGTYGINSTHFSLPVIDIFSDHFYPRNISKLRQGVAAVATTNRVYLADEYDWTSTSGDSLPSFLSAVEDEFENSVLTGDKFWSLFGHNVGAANGCNVFVNHTDGFTFHYGDASTPANITLEREEVRQHLWRLQGQVVALAEPAVACPGPNYEAGTPY
jgi:mannan endo-1,4-beta-mannosidase